MCLESLGFASATFWLAAFFTMFGSWFGDVSARVNAEQGGWRLKYAGLRSVSPLWIVGPALMLIAIWRLFDWSRDCIVGLTANSASTLLLIATFVAGMVGVVRLALARLRARTQGVDVIDLSIVESESAGKPEVEKWRVPRLIRRALIEFGGTAVVSSILIVVAYSIVSTP